jgi:hypothetical protein
MERIVTKEPRKIFLIKSFEILSVAEAENKCVMETNSEISNFADMIVESQVTGSRTGSRTLQKRNKSQDNCLVQIKHTLHYRTIVTAKGTN